LFVCGIDATMALGEKIMMHMCPVGGVQASVNATDSRMCLSPIRQRWERMAQRISSP
jgi:hypothetical protein